LVAGIATALFLTVLATQVVHLVGRAPQFVERTSALADKAETMVSQRYHTEKSTQADQVHAQINKLMDNSSFYFSSFTAFATNMLSQFLLILLFSFFLLYLRVFFLEFFYKVFASADKLQIDDTMQKIYAVIQDYLSGLIKVICIVGTLNTIGLWCLGIESPLFFGFLGGLMVVIPYFGILIGATLPGFKAVGFLLGKPQKYHFKRYSILHAKLRSRGGNVQTTTLTVTEEEVSQL
jgi:predicted PurR-regulated permease PerM